MMINDIFSDKSLTGKIRAERLAELLRKGTLTDEQLVRFASDAKDPAKATCIEAMEYASKKTPGVITNAGITFCIRMLSEDAPRLKWEAAKVTGNVIHLFPRKVNAAVDALLENAGHTGKVVRWSAAYALAAVLRMNGRINKALIPAIEALMKKEDQNSIRKIYHAALKQPV